MDKIAEVVLDTNIDKTLDYNIPSHFFTTIKSGMRVSVKVKNTLHKGYILSLKNDSPYISKLSNMIT